MHHTGTEMSCFEILEETMKYPSLKICITGGEPCMQDLSELIGVLKLSGLEVHLETNGTIYQKCLPEFDWITVSPKCAPGGEIAKGILKVASELKIVISEPRDLRFAIAFYHPNLKAKFFVQPESTLKKATDYCIEFCKDNPIWRLSLQTQKFCEMP